MKKRFAPAIARRQVENFDVFTAIARQVFLEKGEVLWFRLEGVDVSALAGQFGKEKCVVSDICADIDDPHSGPDLGGEKRSLERFVAAKDRELERVERVEQKRKSVNHHFFFAQPIEDPLFRRDIKRQIFESEVRRQAFLRTNE